MTRPLNILVTGANGFVGQALRYRLAQSSGFNTVGTVRRKARTREAFKNMAIGNLDGRTDWSQALGGQDVVIHTAARAHIMKDEVSDPLVEYRKVNLHGTINLARQAADIGVRRFVFISSIKVNGEQTPENQPFTAEDSPSPEDAYGFSKLEAEEGLKEVALQTGMELVIIRPPLVYGPSAKGNFARMIGLVEKGFPLPFGAIHNKRSLIALDNLVDLIITCIRHPAAANQVFLACDGEDLSTTQLLRAIAEALGKPLRLIPIPPELLMTGATMMGKKAIAERLLGSLQVDITKAQDLLGWQPPISVAEGMARAVRGQVG